MKFLKKSLVIPGKPDRRRLNWNLYSSLLSHPKPKRAWSKTGAENAFAMTGAGNWFKNL